MIIESVLQSVGDTPLLSLGHLLPPRSAALYLKLEGSNPGGSVKDRPAIAMIDAAERQGRLSKGGTIVESTSGNLGVALAMVAAVKGYRCIIVVDPRTSRYNVSTIRALGAEVDMVTEVNPVDGTYQEARIQRARSLAATIPGAFMPWQYGNPNNPRAHEASTASEILEDFPDGSDVLVAAVSTGGQISGISRGLKRRGAKTRTVGVDVVGSAVFGGVRAPTAVTGMGLGWVPDNLDEASIDEAHLVEAERCFNTARLASARLGVLLGGSCGASLFVAIGEALKRGPRDSVVAVGADRGEKYLDEFFDDGWMSERGYRVASDWDEILRAAEHQQAFRSPASDLLSQVA